LEVLGHGIVAGCGKEAVGITHHIRALFGFPIAMLFTMGDMYSFKAGGDDISHVELPLKLT
jgi:hypothetical protein